MALRASTVCLLVLGCFATHAFPAGIPAASAAEQLRPDPSAFDVAEIQSAYRQVLALRAAGAGAPALAELTALEAGVLGVDGRGLDRLFKAEAQVVRDLEARAPESLLPVLVLHHDSYGAYRQRQNAYLSVHARNMAQTVAAIYAGRATGPEARRATASVLVSLASFLQDASLSGFAASLYARALELDPDDEIALLGLGALFEKSGKYEVAEGYLTRLVAAHPGAAEGRLRLALTRARNGKVALGRQGLEELLAGTGFDQDHPPPGWILNLAYQELARLHADAGSYREARALLERAVARFPADARLTIELAAVLERLGEPRAARAAVAKLDDGTTPLDRGESSRLRYSRWAPEALVATRAGLLAAADARLAVLSQALGSAGRAAAP